MALMTGEQYIESIKKINMQVYMFGKKIEDPTEDPILRPSLNSVRMTYDLAQMPEYQDLMTVISPYTGERVHPYPPLHRRSAQQGEDAAPAGPEDRFLLPALRGYGCLQCCILHYL